ncbi:hypothetical protein D3C85_1316500 [compost metagenome]
MSPRTTGQRRPGPRFLPDALPLVRPRPLARLFSSGHIGLLLKLAQPLPIPNPRSYGGQAVECLGVRVGQHIREYAVAGGGHRIWCRPGSIRLAFDLGHPGGVSPRASHSPLGHGGLRQPCRSQDQPGFRAEGATAPGANPTSEPRYHAPHLATWRGWPRDQPAAVLPAV